MNRLIDQLLPYLSFGLSLVGLVAQLFRPSGSRKSAVTLIAACLVVITGFGLYQICDHARQIDDVSADIITTLGTDTKTFDELHQALFKVDVSLATEALDSLIKDKSVGQKMLEARDNFGTRFTFRGYYLTARGREGH